MMFGKVSALLVFISRRIDMAENKSPFAKDVDRQAIEMFDAVHTTFKKLENRMGRTYAIEHLIFERQIVRGEEGQGYIRSMPYIKALQAVELFETGTLPLDPVVVYLDTDGVIKSLVP